MMRFKYFVATVLAVGVFGLAGCHRKMTMAQARQTTIISVDGAKVTGTTMERWLLALPARPDASVTDVLIGAWLDELFLSNALIAGTKLDDSATVDAAIAPDAARIAVTRFVVDRAGIAQEATEAEVDSVIRGGQVRVFQQLMLTVPPRADTAALRSIDNHIRALNQAAHKPGANFTAMVRVACWDAPTKANDGFVPAAVVLDLLPELRGQLWALRPGEISGVVAFEAGRALVRRATDAESRAAIKIWIHNSVARGADAAFRDSVLNVRQIHIDPDAIDRVRASLREPVPPPDGTSLAWWNGGTLSAETAWMWMTALPSATRMALYAASDSAVGVYVDEMARRQIFLALISPRGPITPEIRQRLGGQYRTDLDSARTALQRVSGGTGTAEQRATAAVDSVVTGKVKLHALPGRLGGILRSKSPVTVNLEALDALIQGAAFEWRPRATRDSGTAKAKPRGS